MMKVRCADDSGRQAEKSDVDSESRTRIPNMTCWFFFARFKLTPSEIPTDCTKSGCLVHTDMYRYVPVCTKYILVRNVENGTYQYVLVCTKYVQEL
jgi:hypothetical protein